jgi:3-methyladenine DNA glycosylase AlkD
MIAQIVEEIKSSSPSSLPPIVKKVFQLQPGGYGFGDKFCGTSVPTLRKIASKYTTISLENCELLLRNCLHEARFVALIILIEKFKPSPNVVFQTYLDNLNYINNWDLVDCSAHHIIGKYCCMVNDFRPILDLSNVANNIWKNRIAIVATLTCIKLNRFDLTLNICEKFIEHRHHLIHKACGWMLREISKRDAIIVINFINEHRNIPTIMKRYALEFIKKHEKYND